tara:strand:- start:42 stop:248 length:207 start_codon:yes stop_codon:yes gene_type:complete
MFFPRKFPGQASATAVCCRGLTQHFPNSFGETQRIIKAWRIDLKTAGFTQRLSDILSGPNPLTMQTST